MRRELIIDGQHVDLTDKTDITLEYVNNLFGDIGKIELARSYTLKLPRTLHNARILDAPEIPARESSKTRRFLTAHFIQNGIDLLGPARAYILRTTSEEYEIALVREALEALRSLSESKATLNDLPDLPTMSRVPVDYSPVPDADVFFARYNSGLGGRSYPQVNATTHPCVRLSFLLDAVLRGAGIPYAVSDRVAYWLRETVLLAAPSHKPNRAMALESGSSFAVTYTGTDSSILFGSGKVDGWDPLNMSPDGYGFDIEDESQQLIHINIEVPEEYRSIFQDVQLRIIGGGEGGYATLAEIRLSDNAYIFEGAVEVSGFLWYNLEFYQSGLPYTGLPYVEFLAHDPDKPQLQIGRVREELDIALDGGRFPIEGNLPDIAQWDFVKACMALFGLVPVIRDGGLSLVESREILDTTDAYDWTCKAELPEDAEVSYSMDGWSRHNRIAFEENTELEADPAADIQVDDETLKDDREWYQLPFAASNEGNALHYQIEADGKITDIDMNPRIFRVTTETAEDGTYEAALYYPDELRGEGLRDTFYKELQETIRKPVRLTCLVRLNELDLADMDLTRAVYLGQTGRYYAILKIQTSDTDLCKVELIQIA
ncbi:MAG: hypothetical protein IJO87_04385 [Eggerthellaceae bacterium]|nr:hypothetical protein [Eggerthellaceae bacterium]